MGKVLRSRPDGEREIIRLEAEKITNRRRNEQMFAEKDIIAARNMRLDAEEIHRLKQKGLTSKLYGTELKEGEK